MNIFILLVQKLTPLYFVISLGFFAGKFLKVNKESISSILIYILTPIVVLNGVVTTKINIATLSLPILFFIVCSIMGLIFLFIGKYIWQDSTKNILGFTAGTGNTGYFGIPVALALFEPSILGIVVLCILGFVLYENSLGFYIAARGSYSGKEAIKKLLQLPSLYAFFLGLIINLSKINLGSGFFDTVVSFRGAYTILGMMLVGLAMAGIKKSFDFKFLGLTFLAKFIVWPLLAVLITWLDSVYFHFYSNEIHQVIMLMSVVPLAANTVAWATELKTQPEKASMAVFLSTIFALFFIPLVSAWFFR